MRARLVGYWVATGLVCFFIGTGGAGQIAQYVAKPHGVVADLGYPLYFFAILGFWKVLGAIVLLVPGLPRIKEWAYAGIVFDLTGAAASWAIVGKYGAGGFHLIAPLVIAGVAMVSWWLRPAGRVLGVLRRDQVR